VAVVSDTAGAGPLVAGPVLLSLDSHHLHDLAGPPGISPNKEAEP